MHITRIQCFGVGRLHGSSYGDSHVITQGRKMIRAPRCLQFPMILARPWPSLAHYRGTPTRANALEHRQIIQTTYYEQVLPAPDGTRTCLMIVYRHENVADHQYATPTCACPSREALTQTSILTPAIPPRPSLFLGIDTKVLLDYYFMRPFVCSGSLI